MTLPPIQPAKLWTFRTGLHRRTFPEDYWQLIYQPTSRYQIRFSLGYQGSLINVKHELNQPQQSREQTTLDLLWRILYPNHVQTIIRIPYSKREQYRLSQTCIGEKSTAIDIDESLIQEKKDLINWFWTTNGLPKTMEEFPI